MGCSSSVFKNNPETQNFSLSLNNDIVDKILTSAPERIKTSLEELTNFFKSQSKLYSLTDPDKILLVYKWISNNIIFDCEDYINILKKKEDMNYLAQEEIFSEGKTTSHGYSTLFITILSGIDEKIEVKLIKGYVKNFIYKYGMEYDEPNHEWLAVNISNRWHLVDPAFGSGYCNYINKKLVFIPYYNKFYCFPPPELFIKTHFPEDQKYQFISKKIKIDTFYKYPIYKTNFFNFGFKSVKPEEVILNVEKEGKIIINLQKDIDINNLFLSGKMSYKENNKIKTEENTILIEKKENFFEVFFYVNKNYEYKLTIFGINSINDKDDFKELVIYKIIKNNNEENNITNENNKKNDINNNDSKYFPTIFDKFSLSDIILIEPRNYHLIKGEKINFKLMTNIYKKNLFFVLEDENGDQLIELEKNYNNIFEENQIYIHGKKANLIYLNDNNYMDYLLEYKLIDNPNNKNNISFPKVYKSVKNKLIEPLCDRVKKGETINFKIEIKNDNVEKVIILEGDKMTELNQENNLFFGQAKINGVDKNVNIAYKEKNGENLKIIYSYKII